MWGIQWRASINIGTRRCLWTVDLKPPDVLSVAKSRSVMVLVQMEFHVSVRFVHLIYCVRTADVSPRFRQVRACSGFHIRDGEFVPVFEHFVNLLNPYPANVENRVSS